MKIQLRVGSKTPPLWAASYLAVAILVGFFAFSSGHSLTNTTNTTASALAAADSRWSPPLATPMRLLAPFNPPAHNWLSGHRGVDLGSSLDSPVRAAGSGTVHFVGKIVDRPVISINHGELRTTYEPVKSDLVKGQWVASGQVIGTIAAGGHCDSRCLHWGLLRGEVYLNPLALLKTDPPVLKPPK